MADVKITDEIRNVLERCEFTDTYVRLPEQLDRRLYEQVNTVLLFAGCKWSRKDKAHLFTGDAKGTIERYLADGRAPDEKKQFQSFYTPTDYADELASLANVKNMSVLEPSAGGGALAAACARQGAKITCIEIRPEAVLELRLMGFLFVHCHDFLGVEPKREPEYDRIVMNPPFSNNQDCQHVAHALRFLKPGGRLVAVMAGNKSRRKLLDLKEMVALDGHDWIERDVETNRFKESGTGVATFTLVIDKAK